MTLVVDGVTITEVNFNGTPIDSLTLNGVEYFSSVLVVLTDTSDTDYILGSSGVAVSGIRVTSVGRIEKVSSDELFQFSITPTSAAPDYQFRATVLSGSPAGEYNTWFSFGTSSKEFTLSRGIYGTSLASIRIEIRKASTGEIVASANYSLESTKENQN